MMRTDMPVPLASSAAATRVPSCRVPKSTRRASTAANVSAGSANAGSNAAAAIRRQDAPIVMADLHYPDAFGRAVFQYSDKMSLAAIDRGAGGAYVYEHEAA